MAKNGILRIVLPFLALTSLLVFTPFDLLWEFISPLPNTGQEQVNESVRYGLDGVVAYIDIRGEKPKYYTAGWKDRALKIPFDPKALFKIASISKLYMAVAVAKLVQSHTLSLDKSLADYLPDLAGRIHNAKEITLRMMLRHRSGIPDFIEDPKFPWSHLPNNSLDFLTLVFDKPADFKPDSRYRYSNTNYLLIGLILDKILGFPFHNYIKREILDPIQLKHTYGSLNEVNLNELTSGYYIGYEGDLKAQNYICPGGSMVASIEDVGLFLRALNNGTLLNKQEQSIYSSIYEYEHTGLLPGYSSIARYLKNQDAVIILFVNTSGGNTWTKVDIVFNRIAKILGKRAF